MLIKKFLLLLGLVLTVLRKHWSLLQLPGDRGGCGFIGCALLQQANQEGLYRHFKAIAEGVAIPQVLYNVPGRTVSDILPDTVDRLASISNIVGIKEATGDMARAKKLLSVVLIVLTIFSGDDPTAHELILLGGKGNISVTANVAPRLMHDICAAALAGDREKVAELDAMLSPSCVIIY